jgi:hypothetical protein
MVFLTQIEKTITHDNARLLLLSISLQKETT